MDKLIEYFRISARVILTIILFTCLSSLASCKKAAPDNGGNTEYGNTGTTLQFKIMSFNIRLYTAYDTGDNYWENRKGAIIKMMKEQMPDVVGFQEPRDNQRDYLMASLPDYSFLYIHAEGGVTTSQSGHTVMAYKTSKFTVVKGGRFWLSPTPDTPSLPWSIAEDQSIRTCVWAELKENTTGNIVYFFTTHLPYKAADNAARKLAVALCLSKMQSIAGADAKIILVGDMNCTHNSTDSRKESLDGLYSWMKDGRDSAPTTDITGSFNNYNSTNENSILNQLDHVFVRNLTPLTFKTINSHNYGVAYISDHYPVTLTAQANY